MVVTVSTKKVIVLAVYKFNHIDRIAFSVKSSSGDETYCVTFDKGRGSCTCRARSICYHLRELAPRAKEWRDSHKAEQAAPAAALDADEIANVIDEDTLSMPVITVEHVAKTAAVVEKFVGPTTQISTKKSADLAPLNGNRPAPVGASTTYHAPRQLASIPMR